MINIILFFLLAGVPLFVLYRFFFKGADNNQTNQNQNNGQLFDQREQFNFDVGNPAEDNEEDYAPTRLSKR